MYVLTIDIEGRALYYKGFIKNDKPVIDLDVNEAAIFLQKETAERVKSGLKDDKFKVIEHKWL